MSPVQYAQAQRGRWGAALAAALALSPLFLAGCGSKTGADKPRGNVLALSAGAQHACATFDNGELKCWGDNRYGQIGQFPRTAIQGQAQTAEHDSLPAPQIVVGLPASAGVVAGITHTCVFTTDRSLACWGGVDWARPARYRMLFNSSDASFITQPALTIEQLSGVSQVSFGVHHLCALVPTGRWSVGATIRRASLESTPRLSIRRISRLLSRACPPSLKSPLARLPAVSFCKTVPFNVGVTTGADRAHRSSRKSLTGFPALYH